MMERRYQDPLGSRASSCYSSSWSDHDAEMHHHGPSDEDWDEGDTFISFTTMETKCEELFEEGLQHKLKGEFDQAIPCFVKCLEGMQECQYFAKLPQTLHSLAESYQSLQCYEQAVEFAQAEKLFYEAVLLDSTKKSQVQESKDGKPKAKRKPFSKKPTDQSWRRGSNPAEYGDLLIKKADEYNQLAKLCEEQKKYELALDYCGKAAKIRKSVFGISHPVTTETLDYLAVLYAEVGRVQYISALNKVQSAEQQKEDQKGNFLHLEVVQSSTSEGDKCVNATQHLPPVSHTSAEVSSTCTSASATGSSTMEHSTTVNDNRPNSHMMCENVGATAQEATLPTGDTEGEKFIQEQALKACDPRMPSLDGGCKVIPNTEIGQDVCSHKSSSAPNETCQNFSPLPESTKGSDQEMNGIHTNKSDLSDACTNDKRNSDSCILNKHSSVETVNESSLSVTPPPTPNKEESFYEPNVNGCTKSSATITGVLSKAPGCVYVPVPEQGIEHARCLPLWVLLLGAFVELTILAYVFFNHH